MPTPNNLEATQLLNRHLLVLLACEPGTIPFILAESALIQAIVDTNWLREAEAIRVCDYLTPRWRSGRVYDLRRGYLGAIQRRLGREFAELPGFRADFSQSRPEATIEYTDFAGHFRKLLEPEERSLFDAWAEDPSYGWQGRYAKRIRKSAGTVSRYRKEVEKRLNEELREQGFDFLEGLPRQDRDWSAEAYVWLLHMHQEGPPADDCPDPEIPDSHWPDKTHALSLLVCDCVRQMFVCRSQWQVLLDQLDDPCLTPDSFRDLLRTHAKLLDQFHKQFLERRATELQPTLDAATFYGRLADSRINLLNALQEGHGSGMGMAARLVGLARQNPPVPFEGLAQALAVDGKVVVCQLNQFRDIYRKHDRKRRGAAEHE